MRLEDITPNAKIAGIEGSGPVEVVTATFHGSDTVSVIYRSAAGPPGEQILTREDEARLGLVESTRAFGFDADPATFKLALEGLRIHRAANFDPHLAVHTSLVEPLPHQLLAVYDRMLQEQPLRFLLADDPGAGKTIMAGLLIKELKIRGDLQRCLVIAPGSLGEQWQDELREKFDLGFEILTNQGLEAAASGNWFLEHDQVIARIDKLARNEDIQKLLEQSHWDLIIVDEAHKMSANWYSGEKKETKRYQLGKLISPTTRNLLLMSATPHNGKQEDFELFLALLDGDRFEGRARDGVHVSDPSDLMLRRVKEELHRFDGSKLFPERRAYVAGYELSDDESELYAEVTDYVREQWNRAEALDGGRKGTIGFALAILQRRLASSPAAIHESLRRRKERLESQAREMREVVRGREIAASRHFVVDDASFDLLDDPDDAFGAEFEELEDEVVDKATAARTVEELEAEIGELARLEELAGRVRRSDRDSKWAQLKEILQEDIMHQEDGSFRKLVIFTEHKDTLHYLSTKLRTLLGQDEAVVTISGGMGREVRRRTEERFKNESEVKILVATDAAGEGINLQRAHLMVNYDLPWNPNRIEQRFGRIHRIGQQQICHLWNLLARNTREGDVYERLLAKLEVARAALGGKVFDVLGRVFEDVSLKDLLVRAVRDNDQSMTTPFHIPELDDALDVDRLRKITEERVLAYDTIDTARITELRHEMEEANLRRLQPHFIREFFTKAFRSLGGRLEPRSDGAWCIRFVPASVKAHDRIAGTRAVVVDSYERVVFDKSAIEHGAGHVTALVGPGHPLFDATLAVVRERHESLLKQGAILVDDRDEVEGDTDPSALIVLEHEIRDGQVLRDGRKRVVSREIQFVQLDRDGTVRDAGFAPHLDLRPATDDEAALVDQLLEDDFFERELEQRAVSHALGGLVPEHRRRVESVRRPRLEKTRTAMKRRLLQEMAHWDSRAAELDEQVEAGRQPKINPQNARANADRLRDRLVQRESEIARQLEFSTGAPVVRAAAVVVPRTLLDQLKRQAGQAVEADPDELQLDQAARDRVSRLAVEAVLQAERDLGFEPEEMPHHNKGFDIRSIDPASGPTRFLEVKGKVQGQRSITISATQTTFARNNPEHFILAIGLAADDAVERLAYVREPFERGVGDDVESTNYTLPRLLEKSTDPC